MLKNLQNNEETQQVSNARSTLSPVLKRHWLRIWEGVKKQWTRRVCAPILFLSALTTMSPCYTLPACQSTETSHRTRRALHASTKCLTSGEQGIPPCFSVMQFPTTHYSLSIVSDDDFLRVTPLQSVLFLAFLSQLQCGIPFCDRFLLTVSLKQSFGLPMLRFPSLSLQ